MSDDLSDLWVHTVSVQTRQASNGRTITYADPADATGFMQRKNKLVRNADGEQVPSASQFIGPTSLAAMFTPGSKVTYGTDPARTVIACDVADSGDLALPDHITVALQ